MNADGHPDAEAQEPPRPAAAGTPAGETSAPLIFVVILTHNGREHLSYSVPSILSSDCDSFHVLLIDNGSSDGSADYVREHFPEVEVHAAERNLGWAGGNNLGIRIALGRGARYVVLANDDIRVHPRWLRAAVEVFRRECEAGVVGFHVFGAMQPGRLEDFRKASEEWEELAWQPAKVVHGMAMAVRAEVFEDIGLIDEKYFLYGEETDFETRAGLAHYRIVETNVPVWHCSQGTSAKTPVKASWFAMRNALRGAIKNDSPAGILRTIFFMFNAGCNPWYEKGSENVCIRRLRPGSRLFNAGLFCLALLWNVFHVPWTLRTKARERQLIREAIARRKRLDADRAD